MVSDARTTPEDRLPVRLEAPATTAPAAAAPAATPPAPAPSADSRTEPSAAEAPRTVSPDADADAAVDAVAGDADAVPDADADSDADAERPQPAAGRGRLLWERVTSIPVLAVLLIATTIGAAGPLQGIDGALDRHWLYHLAPQLLPLVQGVLDRIAGQAVCLPVLAAVAVVLAVRRRSWWPLLVALAAELAFLLGIGGLKLLIARPSPTLDDADLLAGGIQTFGEKGISFPSGHAAEAVLIYGAVAYLIARYSQVGPRALRIVRIAVVLIALNSVVTSLLLGWHWASDLLGGVLAGALCLRVVMLGDRWWVRRRERTEAEAADARDVPGPSDGLAAGPARE
jgi:membrane-associated phospholipid phosphatase